MKKATIILLLLLQFIPDGYGKTDIYGRKHYSVALHVNTPTGLMSKYGGGIEFRIKNIAILYNYNKYIGAYPGFQMFGELETYLRTAKRHQSYLYFRGLVGDAGYDGKKISMFGYPTDIQILKQPYIGAGTGYGRRWNFNSFFVTFSTGLKYCYLIFDDYIDDRVQNMYGLFRYTGPGAYVDAHFQFGIQL